VQLFLNGVIGFTDLTRLVSEVLDAHAPEGPLTLESIAAADRWARSRLADLAASKARR
jgi:1-deoxy-D-xylulose-5-phosphate reductoisomerase